MRFVVRIWVVRERLRLCSGDKGGRAQRESTDASLAISSCLFRINVRSIQLSLFCPFSVSARTSSLLRPSPSISERFRTHSPLHMSYGPGALSNLQSHPLSPIFIIVFIHGNLYHAILLSTLRPKMQDCTISFQISLAYRHVHMCLHRFSLISNRLELPAS